jgi:ATP-dependent Clp protease ATP-binding subunit ClpA
VTTAGGQASRWCAAHVCGLPLDYPARRLVAFAELRAELAGQVRVGTEHLLASLLEDDDGLTAAALAEAGAPLGQLLATLATTEAAASEPIPALGGRIALDPSLRAALDQAGQLAQARDDQVVTPRDLLRAVLAQPDGGAARTLAHLGVDPRTASGQVDRVLAGLPAVGRTIRP